MHPSSPRKHLLDRIVAEIRPLARDRIVRVGVDGVDGAGKTCMANELASLMTDMNVIRASVDDFHNTRSIRHARGVCSPEGFFLDSFNYPLLRSSLLDPLSPGGSRSFRAVAFDHRSDQPVEVQAQDAPVPSVLIFDGIFLHRDEFCRYWDYSIFLEVSTRESVRRCVERAGVVGVSSDPADAGHRRYVGGQEIYLGTCDPASKATRVIDNEKIENPYIAPPRN